MEEDEDRVPIVVVIVVLVVVVLVAGRRGGRTPVVGRAAKASVVANRSKAQRRSSVAIGMARREECMAIRKCPEVRV
jgi:hypothetical protein